MQIYILPHHLIVMPGQLPLRTDYGGGFFTVSFSPLILYLNCPPSWELQMQKLTSHLLRTQSLKVLSLKA